MRRRSAICGRSRSGGSARTSLRRLGVERIDLYQFHWPDETGTPVEDSWGEMSRLAQEGKIRAAGVSNFNVALLERCERIRPRGFAAAAVFTDPSRCRRGADSRGAPHMARA